MCIRGKHRLGDAAARRLESILDLQIVRLGWTVSETLPDWKESGRLKVIRRPATQHAEGCNISHSNAQLTR